MSYTSYRSEVVKQVRKQKVGRYRKVAVPLDNVLTFFEHGLSIRECVQRLLDAGRYLGWRD